MSLYTGTGDAGETGLSGNQRVPKEDLRIAAYGTVDELNCLVGLLRAEPLDAETAGRLETIQDLLFEVGADLAKIGGDTAVPRVQTAIGDVEQWIDESEAELEPLRSFILPAGHREAALCHVLRAVARRAERSLWALGRRERGGPGAVPTPLGVYLNRLSDLFFSLARRANRRHSVQDVPWRSRKTP